MKLNVILLCSIGAGRTQLARSLLDALPKQFMTIREPEEEATEFQDYSQFFLIWDTLNMIAETAAAEPTLSRESKAAWLKGYKVPPSPLFSSCASFMLKRSTSCSSEIEYARSGAGTTHHAVDHRLVAFGTGRRCGGFWQYANLLSPYLTLFWF